MQNLSTPIFNKTIQQHRGFVSSIKNPLHTILAKDSLKSVEVTNTGETIELHRSTNITKLESYNTFVYIPGNAFVANESVFTDAIAASISKNDTQVLVVRQKLSPESKFPSPLIGMLETFLFLIENCENFKINKSKILIGGYSSGGNLALNIAILCAKLGIHFNSCFLFSPLLNLNKSAYQDDKSLPSHFIDWFIDQYIPNNLKEKSPLISPFFHCEKDLSLLSSVQIYCGKHDAVRNQCDNFFEKMQQLTVNSNIRYLESGHNYMWEDSEFLTGLSNEIQKYF